MASPYANARLTVPRASSASRTKRSTSSPAGTISSMLPTPCPAGQNSRSGSTSGVEGSPPRWLAPSCMLFTTCIGERLRHASLGVERLRVIVLDDAAGLAGVGAGDRGAVLVGAQQRFLVPRHAVGLGRGDEAGAHPDAVGAQRERGGQAAAVDDPPGRHHGDALAHRVDDLRDQGEGRDLAGVPARLGALGDDDVAARLHRGDGVAHLAAHAHDEDVAAVAEVDDVARHAEAGDEHRAAPVDDVVDLGGHVARRGGEEVDAEGLRGELAHLGDLVADLVGAHGRRAHAPEPACLAHRGDEAVVRHAPHARQHHGVLDLQDVSESRAHGEWLEPP